MLRFFKKDLSVTEKLKTNSLFQNVIFNGTAKIARAGLHILVTPIIIALLGPEQYGIAAFAIVLQTIFFMLDQAISPAIIREFGQHHSESHIRSIFSTFEAFVYGIGILIGSGIIFSAPVMAEYWLQAPNMDQEHLIIAIRLVGVYLTLLFPTLLYTSCFIGLQRQGGLTLITTLFPVLQFATAIFLLEYWIADILVLLSVQCIFALLMSLSMRVSIQRLLPKEAVSKIKPVHLWQMKNFIGGTFAIGITTVILTQADKIFVSKAVDLDAFSAYTLSFNIVFQMSTIFSAPFIVSIQPIMAKIMKSGSLDEIQLTYHQYSQIISIIMYTVFGTLAAFHIPVITLWLGAGSQILDAVITLSFWVIIGSLINGLSIMPFIAQISAGQLKFKLYLNAIQAILFLICVPVLIPNCGLIAGPIMWVLINLCYVLIEAPYVSKTILGNTRQYYFVWFLQIVLLPSIISIIVLCFGVYFQPLEVSGILTLIYAGFCALALGTLLIFTMPYARQLIIDRAKGVLKDYDRRT